MPEELNLVTELAIILIAAGVFTVISKALKQPLILGYIVAGFLVGPNLGIFPQFSSESVHVWSEIGIIFLLFSLGLEFSFKKLLKIGSNALVTAGTNCIGMFAVGMIVGALIGWTTMESIFLGGLLSMSSTTIIIKSYTDMGLKKKPYASLVFGILVFEDLIAVLLLVLLSTIAVSNRFAGAEMAFSLAKLLFFIILWFLVGIYVIPTLLTKARRYISDEILLVVSVGLCFLMVYLANLVGFSSALGAFVMGSILSETMEGEHIARLTQPIKDLFGAIFFVSVGMMVDPAVIAQHWPTIIFLALVVICGKMLLTITGVLFSGKDLDTAVHCGFSLALLGEFAFIIAGLGCSLGVMREFIYPVIIAVSVLTTFTSPYIIKAADPALALIRRKMPAIFLEKFDRPQDPPKQSWSAEGEEWKVLFKHYFLRIGLYGVILIALMLGSRLYLEKVLLRVFPSFSTFAHNLVYCGITLGVMAPFLYGMAVESNALGDSAKRLIKADANNKLPVFALMLLRVILAVLVVLIEISEHFQLAGWILLLISLVVLVISFWMKITRRRMSRLEKRFMKNLNEKENYERSQAPVTTSVTAKLSGYDVHIEKIKVSEDFSYVGKTLREMPFRHVSGVNILKIARGSRSVIIPSGDAVIYPGDTLIAVGTTEQIESFVTLMEENSVPETDSSAEDFIVDTIRISEKSFLLDKCLKDTDMRGRGCMVISVLRDGKIITNPKPDFAFLSGDVVWMAGLRTAVSSFE